MTYEIKNVQTIALLQPTTIEKTVAPPPISVPIPPPCTPAKAKWVAWTSTLFSYKEESQHPNWASVRKG